MQPVQMGSVVTVDVFIDPASGVGLAEQIYEQIRGGIMNGRLGPGDRLPPSRELAATLRVSRHTVTTAYGRLSAEGFLDGLRGGGTVVSDLFHHKALADHPDEIPVPPAGLVESRPVRYDLRPGAPDPQLFPASEWKRYARWAVDQHDAAYPDPAGVADLRLVLAKWIARSRGVDAGFRQLVVTSGAQQALYLLARVWLDAGDTVAIEDPGYRPFRRAAESIGADIVPVPVDEEGVVVDAIPPETRLVYVTPSHQFPTGVTMSMRRRLDLLDLARRHDMLIVEDDYDSEYRYVDRPLEPLFRLDRHGTVAYVAGFSKILSPALRLGFTVTPPRLVDRVVELRQMIDWAPSTIDQLTLRGFVADGHLDRHLRRVRPIYRARHHTMTGFLQRLADQGHVGPPASQAGLHVAVRLDRDETDIIERLADRGVAANGFTSHSITATTSGHGLVFGFGSVTNDQLEDAVPIIEDAITG
jgi:GntR family transcriptional regulator/MocR family aminotransferase